MARPVLEVADIFRDRGPAWRLANAGHVSLDQMKVMSAIESCRTAALGGHVVRCEDCSHVDIAYNSCLMGKFRNGEPAHGSIGLSVDLESFHSPLRGALGQDAQPFWRSTVFLRRCRATRPQWLRGYAHAGFRGVRRRFYKETFRLPRVARTAISQRGHPGR